MKSNNHLNVYFYPHYNVMPITQFHPEVDVRVFATKLFICDAIKQNQSELGNKNFSISYRMVKSIFKAGFCRKPY